MVDVTGYDSFRSVRTKTTDNRDLIFYAGSLMFSFQGDGSLWKREDLEFSIGDRFSRVDACAPIAALACIFNGQTATNAGWATDNCQYFGLDAAGNLRFKIALAVGDTDGFIFRAAFQATVLGILA